MKFLYPSLLFALFALAIPVLIHLFQLRRTKTIYFSNVNFLRQIKEQTRKMSVLQHWLVLLMRLLAFAFLILAFARPYLPSDSDQELIQNRVSIYVDNSLSMEAENSNGVLLDQAIQHALHLVREFGPDDEFHVLTNETEGSFQRFITQTEAEDYIEGIQPTRFRLSLEEIVQNQSAVWTNRQANHVFWLSDFQESMLNADEDLDFDGFPKVNLMQIENDGESNVYIDSVYFSAPLVREGLNETLRARVVNSGNQDVEGLSISLRLDGQQRALANLNLQGNRSEWVDLQFQTNETGWKKGSITLEDFPIQFDNVWHLSYEVPERYSVLEISDAPSPYLKALFSNEPGFNFLWQNPNQLALDSLSGYNLIVWHGEISLSTGYAGALKSYMESGGNLALFPAKDPENTNPGLRVFGFQELDKAIERQESISKLEYDHPLYASVFEERSKRFDPPLVKKFYPLQSTGGIDVLETEYGNPFMVWNTIGKGNIARFSSALDQEWTSFQRHALFVPTLFNMAIYASQQRKPGHVMGSNSSVQIRGKSGTEQPVRLIQGDQEFIPDQIQEQGLHQLFIRRQIAGDGTYSAFQGEEFLGYVSLNYDRKESELIFPTKEKLEEVLNSQGLRFDLLEAKQDQSGLNQNAGIGGPKEYWWHCILIASIFLLLETFLLKRFKA